MVKHISGCSCCDCRTFSLKTFAALLIQTASSDKRIRPEALSNDPMDSLSYSTFGVSYKLTLLFLTYFVSISQMFALQEAES